MKPRAIASRGVISLLALFAGTQLFTVGCSKQGETLAPLPMGAKHTYPIGPDAVRKEPDAGHVIAMDGQGKASLARLAPDATGGVTSNDWWSSLIYPQDPSSIDSLPLYAHPLVFQTHPNGLGVSYPKTPTIAAREYMHRYAEDFVVGLQGFEAERLLVTGHSDYAVDVELSGADTRLGFTIGHGLPFAQFRRSKREQDVTITFANPANALIEKNSLSTVVWSTGDRTYAAFAPSGTWKQTQSGLQSDLGGKAHFAVAALPDGEDATLALFQKHAFAFVKDTLVTWNVSGSEVVSTYATTTELVEPCTGSAETVEPIPSPSAGSCERTNEALVALYPHLWGNSQAAQTDSLGVFNSPRGPMRLVKGQEFQTKLTVQGLLPTLPPAPDEEGKLKALLALEADGELFPKGLGETPDHDAYWDGKSMGRLSQLAMIADTLDLNDQREELLDAVSARLEDWFDGQAPRYFYYNETWRSLIAFPDSYGSATHLNDHHFHYGYFIQAAATVARFRPKWAEKHKDMVESLIRDVAATARDDKNFPRLRHMDPFAGHSWANGPAQFYEGNNEESSSEEINFSYSVALWGALTGSKEYEDLGLYLYATQVSAVEDYWFDVHERVFPQGFEHPTIAMVWGAGGKYDTWFDQDPGIIHGINFLPITGGSLYLGRHPDYVRKNFQTIVERSYGQITTWRDCILAFGALGDPQDALERYEDDELFQPEFGASRTMTHLWITSLAHYGLPDFSTKEAAPYRITLANEDARTSVVFTPHQGPKQGPAKLSWKGEPAKHSVSEK